MAKALPLQHHNMHASDHHDAELTGESDDSDNETPPPHAEEHSSHSPSKSSGDVKNNHTVHDNSLGPDSNHKEDSEGQMLNGTVQVHADRYGFIGGKEFTDPDQ